MVGSLSCFFSPHKLIKHSIQPAIASYHTAQEFSNTAWALATLHSKRGANTSPEAAVEDDGIVRILRWVSKFIIQNVDSFKPQELSNR